MHLCCLVKSQAVNKLIRIRLLGMKFNCYPSLLQKQSNGSHFSVIDIITTRKSPKPSYDSEHQEKLMWWSTSDQTRKWHYLPLTHLHVDGKQTTSPVDSCAFCIFFFCSIFQPRTKCVSMACWFTCRVLPYALFNLWSCLGGVMGIWGMIGSRGENRVKGPADGCWGSSAQADNRWQAVSIPWT